MSKIVAPYPIFVDSDGTPLEAGYVYLGEINQNPETHPINVYWDEDLTQAAAQPLRTSAGAFYRAGTPANVFADEAYSITIRDKNRVFVATFPNSSTFANIGDEQIEVRQPITGAVTRTQHDKNADFISIKDLGGVGDGVTDDSSAFAKAEALSNKEIYLPDGDYVVNSLSLSKVYPGPGIIELDGDNRPHGLDNARQNRVILFPPVNGLATLLKPDGTWFSTFSSTTSGIQEALNYSCGNGTAGTGDFDLYVVGAVQKSGSNMGKTVDYPCTSPIIFPPMRGKYIEFGACSVRFSGGVGSASCVKLDSMHMTKIIGVAQFVGNGSGHVVEVAPTNPRPVDNVIGIKDSKIQIFRTVSENDSITGVNGALLKLDPFLGEIRGTDLDFGTIHAENSSNSSVGIYLTNPGSGSAFVGNTSRCRHLYGVGSLGLKYGSSAAIADVYGNTWHINSSQNKSQAGSSLIDLYGSGDIFFINVEDGTLDHAAILESSASDNLFFSSRLNTAQASIVNNSNYPTSNRLIRTGALSQVAQTVGGSPYTYQNQTIETQKVIVQGGTLTANTQFSLDGSSFYDAGQTSGSWDLEPGTYLKVTYSVAPNVRVFAH